MPTPRFRFVDRHEAGQLLAHKLATYAGRSDVLVLALPRGGVPVAAEIANELDAPLDVVVVRKLGVPDQEELAMGAITSGAVRVLDMRTIEGLGIDRDTVEEVTAEAQRELARREQRYRGDRPFPAVEGKTLIVVDDGVATGNTMASVVQALRKHRPARIVVAVPVASRESVVQLRGQVDQIVCLLVPEPFGGVGLWYADFAQTSDDEVRSLLARAAKGSPPSEHG